MKKLIIFAAVAVLAVSAVFAQMPPYIFSVGTTISRSEYEDSDAYDALANIGLRKQDSQSIAIGAEFRSIFHGLKIGMTGEFTVLSPQFLYFSGMTDVGVFFDIKDVVGVGISTGPMVDYLFIDKAERERNPAVNELNDGFFEEIVHGDFNYRVTLDAIVGSVLRVGLAYTFPTKFNLDDFKIAELNPFKKGNFDKGRISFCLQMRIF